MPPRTIGCPFGPLSPKKAAGSEKSLAKSRDTEKPQFKAEIGEPFSHHGDRFPDAAEAGIRYDRIEATENVPVVWNVSPMPVLQKRHRQKRLTSCLPPEPPAAERAFSLWSKSTRQWPV